MESENSNRYKKICILKSIVLDLLMINYLLNPTMGWDIPIDIPEKEFIEEATTEEDLDNKSKGLKR